MPPKGGGASSVRYNNNDNNFHQSADAWVPSPSSSSPAKSPDSRAGEEAGHLNYGAINSTANEENNNLLSLPDGTDAGSSFSPPYVNNNNKRQHHRSGFSDGLIKTHNTFLEDAAHFEPGTIPHSMVLALCIGIVCGIAAFVYYWCLEWALQCLWKTIPEQLVILGNNSIPESLHVLWIPLVGFTLATLLGLSVVCMGEPGDLPYTIKCVHEQAYVAMDHVLPMLVASQLSILGGGSLGPEAPLVAICAALGGFVSRRVFGCRERNLVRKHTFMGMAGALAAFFGCPLGGSLFAMEITSRWGIEYFEHTVEAIFCGEVCLTVFRSLAGLPIQPIWDITNGKKLEWATPLDILYGAALGLLGALVATVYAHFHWQIMGLFGRWNLLDNARAVYRAWVGAFVLVLLGALIPQTMFWGEFEFQTIATMSPASTLVHIWPTSGLLGFEMDSAWTALLVGVTKLIAISFTVTGGYRGGYIFPLFAASAALGRALFFICPFIPVQLCVLCLAAAVNVAVTRTSLASTIILAHLSGEPNAVASILMASLVSLFVTGYMPFIATQVSRVDLEHSTYRLPEHGNTNGRKSCRRNRSNAALASIDSNEDVDQKQNGADEEGSFYENYEDIESGLFVYKTSSIHSSMHNSFRMKRTPYEDI